MNEEAQESIREMTYDCLQEGYSRDMIAEILYFDPYLNGGTLNKGRCKELVWKFAEEFLGSNNA